MISKKGLAILTGQRAGQFPLYLSPSQLSPKMATGVLDLVYVYVFLHVTVETCICTLSKNPVVLGDVPEHMHQFPFLMLRCPRASRSQAFNTGFPYQTLCTETSQNFLIICKIDYFFKCPPPNLQFSLFQHFIKCLICIKFITNKNLQFQYLIICLWFIFTQTHIK